MLKKLKFRISFFILLNLFFSINSFSQKNLYAGIEIGTSAIKVSVLEVINIKKAEFNIVYFANESLALAEHISTNNEISKDYINKTGIIIFNQLKIIREKFKIPEENIFIIGASVFTSATNVSVLKNKITTLTNKSFDIINIDDEVTILVKGSIPPADYSNAVLIDIGVRTTRGGYIEEFEDNKLHLIPLELDFGTVTLTDAVIKTVANQSQINDMSVYQEKSFDYNSVLRKKAKEMVDKNPFLLKKEKIYLTGAALWAFTTLYYNENDNNHFVTISIEDIINYDAIIKNNFNKFNSLSKVNKEAARILNTYDQKQLISANNILLACLESIPNLETRKIYFAKESQISWLLSYIFDRSKK